MYKSIKSLILVLIALSFSGYSFAQVNAVKFGKNRIQYKKFKWSYYQSANFNVYFYEGGQELAKYVAQEAEKELPQIESATEYSLQRRANIVLYNSFSDFQQNNIGTDQNLSSSGGFTQLVNNKVPIYFDANHANLKRQIRQGISDVITKNLLFGDDIGEVAGNQTLLDLPKWFTDGYTAYIGENWSTDLDDELKSEMLSGKYNRFSDFAFENPLLAGHAFWFFIEEKYKKENVTYFLYLARSYKNLNKASVQITKKKFKPLLQEFMEYQDNKYSKDVTRRKAYPKGSQIDGYTISKRLNYYRFNVNPKAKNNSYVVTEYKRGITRVVLHNDYENTTLLKYGVRNYENQIHPNYPLMAWDPSGTRIAVVYPEEGKLKMFVYDAAKSIKTDQLEFTDQWDQIQDIKYMYDNKKMMLTAVKNGHTNIYQLDIGTQKVKPITNDVYDDLDASLVAFPGKTGIIFSSNRPSPNAKGGDSVLPSNNRFNIFLITDFDKPELNQITQLTNLKYGDARYPMQYNENHFTFISDENGIQNRYAGFFTTTKEGYDTLVVIGDDILRNPTAMQVDSALRVAKKMDVDSVAIVSISSDSAYSFPLSNYPSNIAETRVAGDNHQVSEVTRQSDDKILYKLKIDENTLKKRNITAQPTAYAIKRMRESRLTEVAPAPVEIPKTPEKPLDDTTNMFQTEFEVDSSIFVRPNPIIAGQENKSNVLGTLKLFKYKPVKFSANFGSVGITNQILINRYQPYAGGSGPVQINGSTPLNGMVQLGIADVMEDYHINGAFKLSSNLRDNEWYVSFDNLRRRLNWGLSYYRNVISGNVPVYSGGTQVAVWPARQYTNLYQGKLSWPFNEVQRIEITTGIRSDNLEVLNDANNPLTSHYDHQRTLFNVNQLAWVHDNTLNPALNIWEGLRYKIFANWDRQISDVKKVDGPNTWNVGFDARHYYPIYRNFIWAVRGAADFSFGNRKILYYLGGMDGWLMFGNNQKIMNNGQVKDRYFMTNNPPANDQDYAFEALAQNLRGFKQNIANGNNALVINSEFRLPILSTFFDKQVSNKFLNNFQVTQFFDLGTAWNGQYNKLKRPTISYGQDPLVVKVKAGGVGPFAGGYGFGARSMLLGYFLKYDVAWQMNGFFKGKPQMYFSMGLDF